MTIATRLDAAMEFSRIPSQSELARRSGVPQPTINRILKGVGKNGPETGTLAKLADACGVRFEWLASGMGGMTGVADQATQKRAEPFRPTKKVVKGDLIEPERLAEMNVITEREARILARFRAASEASRNLIETAVFSQPALPRAAIVDDKSQRGLLGMGDSERN